MLLYSAAAEQRDTGNPSPSTKPLLTKHKPSYCYYVARSPLKLTAGPSVKNPLKINPRHLKVRPVGLVDAINDVN